MVVLLSRLTAPGDLPYPEQIMPAQFLGPDKRDWFCRNVLAELAVYRHAVAAGSPIAAHEGLLKTPAAIGQSIRRLEEHLGDWLNGGALIDHSVKKSIRTTEAGGLTVDFAEKVLAESESFLANLDAMQHSNQVRLACIHSAWMAYGPELQSDFAKRVPGGTIQEHVIGGPGYPENIVAQVLEGSADAGITSYPPKVLPPLKLQLLKDRRLVLVFSAKYPKLPKEKAALRLDRVISRDENLKIAVHHRASESPLGNQVVYYLNRQDAFTGKGQLTEAGNIAEIKATIERFPGTISILPEDVITEEIAQGRLKAYPLDPPLKPWVWGLIYRGGTSRKTVLQLIECLRPLFKKTQHK
jgi:DNA-binding transcriptional LysR family regulator